MARIYDNGYKHDVKEKKIFFSFKEIFWLHFLVYV